LKSEKDRALGMAEGMERSGNVKGVWAKVKSDTKKASKGEPQQQEGGYCHKTNPYQN
jgi:hypothetical protein